MSIFVGSGVAIITPFLEDKSIDFVSLEKIIEFQIENKTDAIIVCGTTGEACTLSEEEHLQVVKFTKEKVKGRIPVIAGAGSNNTMKSIKLAKECEKIGVDGLLVITPYYNKTSQEGLINHFKLIASEVSTPIILYNVPYRTGLNIAPKTVLELSKIPNIAGIKEASENIEQLMEIAMLCPKDFDIYSGSDNQILPSLAIGGKGVISVLANVLPNQTHNIIESFLNGDIEKSRQIQFSCFKMVKELFSEASPIPVKTAMSLMGFGESIFREPLISLSLEKTKKLEGVLKEYNLI